MKTYNKGEWSEPYLLLKLIVDQKLYLGEENFKKVKGLFYQIIKIVHFENKTNTEFTFGGDIVIVESNKNNFRIPISEFAKICSLTLAKINGSKSKTGSFPIPELVKFLSSINIKKLKAKSKSKKDITIQIADPKTFVSPTLGFSVKSQLGAPATLVNASKSTNFIYRLTKKLSKKEIAEIDNERLFSEKFKLIRKFKSDIIFEDVQNQKFKINLQSIDYNFPKVLADILLMYYENDDSNKNSIANFISQITKKNEFDYRLDLNSEIYQMIIKRFLVEYALGMRANEIWKRDYQADGGYLIVREDGEVICYHFYFIKNFENYLFQNTKLDTPSRTRYRMVDIFEEKGVQKFTLNLQVRFIQ